MKKKERKEKEQKRKNKVRRRKRNHKNKSQHKDSKRKLNKNEQFYTDKFTNLNEVCIVCILLKRHGLPILIQEHKI